MARAWVLSLLVLKPLGKLSAGHSLLHSDGAFEISPLSSVTHHTTLSMSSDMFALPISSPPSFLVFFETWLAEAP